VTAANLNVTGLTGVTSVYNATTAATLGGSASATALLNDVVIVGGTAVGTFATKDVGNGKAITVTGNTISGPDAGNYNLLQATSLTADVTAPKSSVPMIIPAIQSALTPAVTSDPTPTPTPTPTQGNSYPVQSATITPSTISVNPVNGSPVQPLTIQPNATLSNNSLLPTAQNKSNKRSFSDDLTLSASDFNASFEDPTHRLENFKQGSKRGSTSLASSDKAPSKAYKPQSNAQHSKDIFVQAGHMERVASLSAAIAGELNLSKHMIEGIYIAAKLHDIGRPLVKGGVGYDYRDKNEAQIGYEMIKHINFYAPVAKMILQHHEKLDGSGYLGLKGDSIGPGARIIAVADTVESSMRKTGSWGKEGLKVALERIERGSGVMFDPLAVSACLKIFRVDGYLFPETVRYNGALSNINHIT
jgi:hypothetical protein